MAYVGTMVAKGNTYTETLRVRIKLNFGAVGGNSPNSGILKLLLGEFAP